MVALWNVFLWCSCRVHWQLNWFLDITFYYDAITWKEMIKMIKLPWRGRAETFPHTTEAEPKLSFFKIRISNAIAIVVILTYDEQQLSSPAQSSSASQVSWSSVRASSVASWHHHHLGFLTSSSWHHHHTDPLSFWHHHHLGILVILTLS